MCKLIGLCVRPGVDPAPIVRWFVERLGVRTYRLDSPVHRAATKLLDGVQAAPGVQVTAEQLARRMKQFLKRDVGANMLVALADVVLRQSSRPLLVLDVALSAEAAWVRERGGVVVHAMPPGGYVPVSVADGLGAAVLEQDFVIHCNGDVDQTLERLTEQLRVPKRVVIEFEDACV